MDIFIESHLIDLESFRMILLIELAHLSCTFRRFGSPVKGEVEHHHFSLQVGQPMNGAFDIGQGYIDETYLADF